MHRPPILLFLFIFVSYIAYAQDFLLTGTVKNEKNEPVSFATVYLRNSNIGTAANSEGEFKLRLGPGDHEVLIRAVGYKQAVQKLTMNQNMQVEILLESESYKLEEVVIGEDPAYLIIRNAIQNRKRHLNEATPYTAKVYIKGLQRLLQAPKSFLGVDIDQIGRDIGLDSNRTGIVYLSESESRITVNPPNDFKEEMISSKISGNNRSFSFNRASDLKLNFYENHQPIIDGLSARPFVSPIADNALAYYRYQYQGSTMENGLTINKIKVIPRRKAEPLYEGDIYIIENSWRIYGLNLRLTKASSINLLDTLNIRQEYIPVTVHQWHPANVRFDFVGGLFGFRVGGYFAAIYNEYTLHPAIESRSFREVLRIEEGVNKKDSSYWAENRLLTLTEEEETDYARKDSIRQRRESREYLDSLDKATNKFKPLSFVMTGYTRRNRAARSSISFDGLATSLLYNTVEGLALNYGAQYVKRTDTIQNRSIFIRGNIRYGFSNQRLNGYISTSFPLGKSTLDLSGGSDVQDLNSRGSLPVLFNTINTLLFGHNYKKLYERAFGHVSWRYTLPGNVRLSASTTWENRQWLPNSTEYTLFDRYESNITSNNPFVPHLDIPLFAENQALKATVSLSYNFGTKYETYPNRRVYLPSKYPTLSLSYTKGIPTVLGSDVDYDLLVASLYKTNIGLGLYGNISFSMTAGSFLNNSRLYYTDFMHFNGTQTLITDQQLSSFLLLDYYPHSTTGNFAEVHGEYNLSTILTSKIPLLRKLKLQEIIGLHYMSTSTTRHYGEIHAGLQWQNLRVMYARSLGSEGWMHGNNSIRIGLRIF